MTFYVEFGANVRRARQSRGMAQEQLTKALGLANRTGAHYIERGRRMVTAAEVLTIAATLKVPLAQLLPRVEPRPIAGLPNVIPVFRT